MKYIANPVEVEAWKIQNITRRGDGSLNLLLEGASIPEVADLPMLARYIPKVGDYWVIQSDGYVYLNPKEVFERKYSPASK